MVEENQEIHLEGGRESNTVEGGMGLAAEASKKKDEERRDNNMEVTQARGANFTPDPLTRRTRHEISGFGLGIIGFGSLMG